MKAHRIQMDVSRSFLSFKSSRPLGTALCLMKRVRMNLGGFITLDALRWI